jgi:uncharacterized membrane protein YgdD (TMEM256/DUF423 family)
MSKAWVILAGLYGFVSVAFGAFAAHALAEIASARALDAVHTGASYGLVHAAVLLSLGLWAHEGRLFKCARWAFAIGIALFSGSLFIFGVTEITAHLWLTPIGGVLLLTGWALVVAAGLAATETKD